MKALLLVAISLMLPFQSVGQIDPDQIDTEQGPLLIYPINHGTLALKWNGKMIYVDPYGGVEAFGNLSAPDLVLITDIHGDHLNMKTLEELQLSEATLIAPEAVTNRLGENMFKRVEALGNGEETEFDNLRIAGVAMYNLPDDSTSRHPKGRGNGYVLNLDGKRLYISGDTEDIPEMRALKDIDVAFVCMNLPYTMDIKQAASAVAEFRPRIVYPYHYRGKGGLSDVEGFRLLVEAQAADVEVRLRDWYPSR